MAIDPLIKRIVVDPPSVGVPAPGLRLVSALAFAAFVGTVIYSKHVAPQALEERIKKEMFVKH